MLLWEEILVENLLFYESLITIRGKSVICCTGYSYYLWTFGLLIFFYSWHNVSTGGDVLLAQAGGSSTG